MNVQAPTRILVVDDHQVVRAGLVALLESEADIDVIGQASDGAAAIEQYRELRPDVTLMDLRLPVLSGVEAIREIRRGDPAARILVLTTYDGDEDIHRALDAGARGYLLKDMSRKELLEAIQKICSGMRAIPPLVASKMVKHGRRVELTRRELDVLYLVKDGYKNKQIASRLGTTEGTIKSYITRILAKLEAPDRTAAITIALRRGIINIKP